jgi:hypothetical protein
VGTAQPTLCCKFRNGYTISMIALIIPERLLLRTLHSFSDFAKTYCRMTPSTKQKALLDAGHAQATQQSSADPPGIPLRAPTCHQGKLSQTQHKSMLPQADRIVHPEWIAINAVGFRVYYASMTCSALICRCIAGVCGDKIMTAWKMLGILITPFAASKNARNYPHLISNWLQLR